MSKDIDCPITPDDEMGMARGMTEVEILDDFFDLTHEDIRACLTFAADRERRLAVLPQYEIIV